MDPSYTTSPLNKIFLSLSCKQILPLEWPGMCMTVSCRSPRLITSPANKRVAGKRTHLSHTLNTTEYSLPTRWEFVRAVHPQQRQQGIYFLGECQRGTWKIHLTLVYFPVLVLVNTGLGCIKWTYAHPNKLNKVKTNVIEKIKQETNRTHLSWVSFGSLQSK